jgi:hypothetical protein
MRIELERFLGAQRNEHPPDRRGYGPDIVVYLKEVIAELIPGGRRG